jgi:hypothetical protein
MTARTPRRAAIVPRPGSALALTLSLAVLAVACAPATPGHPGPVPRAGAPPSPDPRVGLRPGLTDAGEAIWNLRMLSNTPPPREFVGYTNSDLAFTGQYAIQGNYRGIQIWDISDPRSPLLVTGFVCPGSQNDVSVHGNLLFVSVETPEGRLDCGTEPPRGASSPERFRGVRILDISDVRAPRVIANVQTCRGSHTHTLLRHPGDDDNVYVYVSGSAPVRPATELPGCVGVPPSEDPRSALFRIEVIRVPLARPQDAAIVASPRIFEGLTRPPTHGLAPQERAEIEAARAAGAFVVDVMGQDVVLPDPVVAQMLAGVVQRRGGTGAPTAADSATLRRELPAMIAGMLAQQGRDPEAGPTQCHDITVYPEVGLAGGACEGYGLLLDIRDPVAPRRLDAVADSNFAYWHSATFNNAGTTVLFTDEWGGGGAPKCRETDPMEWGANAIFTIENGRLVFQSYYKMPAPQTELENCVAHNGSLIPIPGRDVMVQSWYQGGISMFDFTDPRNPVEIGFHDRGPVDAEEIGNAGSWSAYWYNGVIVSSEIGRGLDVFELVPSAHLSRNEIDAALTVRLAEFNPQGQPRFTWPPTFALARAYVDQLERSGGLPAARIAAVRAELAAAEASSGTTRSGALERLASRLGEEEAASRDAARVRALAGAVRDLAAAP